MILIRHRLNAITDLADQTDRTWGAEIDLRSDIREPGRIHLSHDPWNEGEDFNRWLAAWKEGGFTGPLILNTKEDGLEEKCLESLKAHGIENFFFLDTAVPTMVRWAIRGGERRFAARVSSYETEDLALSFRGRVEWVWLDCFGHQPYRPARFAELKRYFRICLVSPELQGGESRQAGTFLSLAKECDAVCTKAPAIWGRVLGGAAP